MPIFIPLYTYIYHYRLFLGIVRHQAREILTERKGAETKAGTVEGLNEGNKLILV